MSAWAYYNEIDPYAAQWLRNLIDAGHIAPGFVDERSVEDVEPMDLWGFRQAHFFAGIGVWSAALRGAGWPDDRPVWTGSCPCQGFSVAGKRLGFADKRHLWPAWFRLIAQSRPSAIFGEQVDSPDARAWVDLVLADLEGSDYAVGALVAPAAGFGAPHGRHRTWFMAHAANGGHDRGRSGKADERRSPKFERRSDAGELADDDEGLEGRRGMPERPGERAAGADGLGDAGAVEHAQGEQARISRLARERRATSGFWADADWIPCRGGKWRPVEPGTFPLAHGVARRVEQLRAYGNAIVLPAATEFIAAAKAALDE